ncbi:hypothetical protein GCM10025868_19930 [Angustibacter aerolatus]|uniref:DeoR-like transcriptional repressor C-terminal sensor domain-containing protein n=1 Tax=Angustibacter aerolatus TaxID=1162965 RepID=A0ABQ6JEZ7_9ACTN|nr:hypothetical protein GCM10025868_19930 [Angustibacter aerolatus]
MNVGTAFVGVDGISATGGLTTHDEVEAHTNAVLVERAAHTVVVADGSKVGRALLARITGVDGVDEPGHRRHRRPGRAAGAASRRPARHGGLTTWPTSRAVSVRTVLPCETRIRPQPDRPDAAVRCA